MVLLNLIVPFIMVLVAKMLKKHPVLDMSSQNGYSTPVSRRSQKHWDYAQSIAPDIYLSLGKILFVIEIILSIVMIFLKVETNTGIVIGTSVGLGCLFLAFYKTDDSVEKEIERK